jgi:hypothetical protein
MTTLAMMYSRRGLGFSAILAVIVLLATGFSAYAAPSSSSDPCAIDDRDTVSSAYYYDETPPDAELLYALSDSTAVGNTELICALW